MLVLGKGFTIVMGDTEAKVIGIRSHVAYDSIGNRVVTPLVDLRANVVIHTVKGHEIEKEIT